MEVLKVYLGSLLGLGFLYFVGIRFYNNKNYKKVSVFTAIFGGVITLISVGGLIYDIINPYYDIPSFSFNSDYYAFLIVAVLLNIAIPLIYLLTGINRHQKFAFYSAKINDGFKRPTTIKDEDHFVYAVFKYNGNFLLRKVKANGEEYFTSFCAKLTTKQMFQDEMVKSIIANFEVDKSEEFINRFDEGYYLAGKIIRKKTERLEEHYYCYVINVFDKNSHFDDYYEISPYELVNYRLSEFDKQMLYHVILKEDFHIVLDK